MRLVVPGSCSLLDAVRALVPGAANRTLRRILSGGRVRVNGAITKVANTPLRTSDVVEVGAFEAATRVHGIDILFEDAALMVVHKPAGLLTVATPHERERTAYAYLRDYLKDRDRRTRLYIVHRLDKFVSGVLVFAKTEEVQLDLKGQFHRHSTERRYWALVEGRVAAGRGTLDSRLVENRAGRVRSTGDAEAGKRAVTHYRVLSRFPKFTVLEVRLETGRKNQIRVHLSEAGHPIVGDRAYGSTTDPLGRLGLHAFLLGFEHPTEHKRMQFRTQPPPQFRKYLPVALTSAASSVPGPRRDR